MKKKTIALDIDNVILDFSSHFIEYLGFKNTTLPKDYRDERFVKFFAEVEEDPLFWSSLPLLDFPNFEFDYYLTSRPTNEFVNTEERLEELGLPKKPVITVGLNKSKLKAMVDYKIDVLVDDCVEHFEEINKTNKLCFLYTSSHNVDYITSLRVNSLEHFYNIVKRM